jgi:hypothetical protein
MAKWSAQCLAEKLSAFRHRTPKVTEWSLIDPIRVP